MLATLGAAVLVGGNQILATELTAIDLTKWASSDIDTVGDDPFGKLVKYGHALFTDTANEIGSAVFRTRRSGPLATILPAKTAISRPARSPLLCL
jgi:hypothetical protein